FVGQKGVRPETWAYGFRNPWRLHIDRDTGDLWVGQNGQDLWEQVYLIEKGANYGWSVVEGSHPFYLDRKAGPTPFSKPIAEHHHSEFRSLTGGVVYHGTKLPALRGAYVYGDFSTGKIWGIRHKGGKATWNFPDGTVLVKTFALEMEAGNPASRRRVETRLLTNQEGEWVGYCYLWEDQADAVLVAAGGTDRRFTIRDAKAPGGKREQTWHFPSRAECMVCHSRA